MKIVIPEKSKWPQMTTAFSSETGSLHMHMKELVRTYGWRIDDPPADANTLLAYLENGTSFFFMVEDSIAVSAYESIRTITNHPVGRLTPILILLLESTFQDAVIYQKVLHVGVAKKPLTPSQFLPNFSAFVKQWETPVFTALRKCGYAILNGDRGIAIESLKKLSALPQTVSFAVQTLTRMYIQQEDWKSAESTLIEAIKAYPRQPSLILAVANFYSEARMPAQALRFYTKLKSVCNNSPIFSFDIAQAALSLGQVDLAIEAFTDWQKARPGNELIDQFIARLYLCEGKEAHLEKILNMNKANLKRLQEIWEKAENSTSQHQTAS